MKASKAAVAINSFFGHLLCLTGYFLGSVMALSLITGFAGAYDESYANEATILGAVTIILCAVAVFTGTRMKKRVDRFRQYVSLMSSQKLTFVGDIADRTSRSDDDVKKDLQKMISKRFFVNASLDMTTNQIIVCASTLPGRGDAVEYDVFCCSGCGATGTRAKGMMGHCDYCGTPVQ